MSAPRSRAPLEIHDVDDLLRDLGLSVYLFVIIPKGFFPQQDVGLISATSEANQDISFADMKRHQEELGKIVMADPDVANDRHEYRRQRQGR